MIRWQTYKFRLKTTPRVERLFAQIAGCCRYVYNRALALNEERWAKNEKRLSLADMCKLLTAWRADPETPWLNDAPAQVLQQVMKNLHHAYVNFFEGRADVPRFKKKGRSLDSFRTPKGDRSFTVAADRSAIRLPKVGWVRFFDSQPMEGKAKNATVSQRCGKWYVSIQTERVVAEPAHPLPGTAVGVDVGVVNLLTLSDGTPPVPPLNALRALEPRIKRLQRSLSRKVKLSSNWRETKRRIARLHNKAANRRNDYLHKLTHAISKNHALVVIEDLQVENMTRSARGTLAKPGKNVRQKAGLNKSILDQGWGELARQLAYKCEWRGGTLLRVDPAYTSQTCSRCGHCERGNRPSQAAFRCLACAFEANADVNAAKVILAAGQAVYASRAASKLVAVPPTERVVLKEEPTSESGEDVKRGIHGLPDALFADSA